MIGPASLTGERQASEPSDAQRSSGAADEAATMVGSGESLPAPTGRAGPSLLRRLAPLLGGVGVGGVLCLIWIAVNFGSPRDAMLYLRGVRVVLEPEVVSVGIAPAGETRRATFRVRNLSSEAVTIVGATQTCTCVTTAGLPITIPPRSGHDLHVTIRIDGKPSEQIAQDVSYFTSSPGHRALKVSVRGQVAD